MISLKEVFTRYANMPSSIRAYTVLNSDDSYTIILNSRLSREQHLLSYYHEMRHIEDGDYEKHCSVDLIELMAHS